jgi:hypothetical protein
MNSTSEKLDYFAGLALQALIAKFPLMDREGHFGDDKDVSKIKSQLAESAWEYAEWMIYHSGKAYQWVRDNHEKDSKPE